MKKFISTLFLVTIIVSGCSFIPGEDEGTVKYDDCPVIVNVQDNSFDKISRRYTCNEEKTTSGKIMSGTCVSLDISNGQCTKAYVYQKQPEIACSPNSTLQTNGSCTCDFGYSRASLLSDCVKIVCPINSQIGLNNTCECNAGFSWNNIDNQCETPEQLSQNICGDNSYYSSDGSCNCNFGYEKNSYGVCVSEEDVCKNEFGQNSYSAGGTQCGCNRGYQWNNGKTQCIQTAYISITEPSLSYQSYSAEPIYIKGDTSSNCTKIIAQSTSSDGSQSNTFKLQNYKYGDQLFTIKLEQDLGDLWPGDNNIQITAYCDENQIMQTSTTIYFGSNSY